MLEQAPQQPKDEAKDRSRSFFDKLRNPKAAAILAGLAITAGGAGKAKAAEHSATTQPVASQPNTLHSSLANKDPFKMEAEVLKQMNKSPKVLNCTIFLPQEKYGHNYPYFKWFPFDDAPTYGDSLSFLNKKFYETVPMINNPRYWVDSHGTEWILASDARAFIPTDIDNYPRFSPYPAPADDEARGALRWMRVKDLPKGSEVLQIKGAVDGGKHILTGRIVYEGGITSNDPQNYSVAAHYIEIDGLPETAIGMLNHVTPDDHMQARSSSIRFSSLEKFIHS